MGGSTPGWEALIRQTAVGVSGLRGEIWSRYPVERSLGTRSDYAQSYAVREGTKESQALSEQGVPLMTAQEIKQLRDEEIIGFHRRLPAFKAKRMDWRQHSLLVHRRRIPPPQLSALPQIEGTLPTTVWQRNKQSTSYIDPDMITRDF